MASPNHAAIGVVKQHKADGMDKMLDIRYMPELGFFFLFWERVNVYICH